MLKIALPSRQYPRASYSLTVPGSALSFPSRKVLGSHLLLLAFEQPFLHQTQILYFNCLWNRTRDLDSRVLKQSSLVFCSLQAANFDRATHALYRNEE